MKTKGFWSLLLIFALLLTLAACGESDEPSTVESKEGEASSAASQETLSSDYNDGVSTSTPLLYKVTDEDGDIVWLFGSIHVGEEDFYPLPAYVEDAFVGADTLAVEVDIVAFQKDLAAQIQALKPLVYADGTTIADHIPEEQYLRAKEALTELKMYNSALDYYCPAMWSSTIESALYAEWGADSEQGVDVYMINWAYELDKEVADIESAEFQYSMLAGFSDGLQSWMLESSLQMFEDSDAARADLQAMMDAWKIGDWEVIAGSSDTQEMTEEELLLYAEYEEAMITNRNLSMAQYAENALNSGKEVFICVGALHVVGEGGMADLLAQKGYTVEQVTQ